MNATIERRLASLEARHGGTRGRVMLLLPWEIMPEEQEGDMIGCYQFVVATPDGPQRVEYQRTGIHPEQDAPGSWNRHLYFGEPYNA